MARQNENELKALYSRKSTTWRSGLEKISEKILKNNDHTVSCEKMLQNPDGQKWKQRVKRKATQLLVENRVRRRKLTKQGRPSLINSEDEEFLERLSRIRQLINGRRKDTVMYTNRRVKTRDCLNTNNNLERKGKKLI